MAMLAASLPQATVLEGLSGGSFSLVLLPVFQVWLDSVSVVRGTDRSRSTVFP